MDGGRGPSGFGRSATEAIAPSSWPGADPHTHTGVQRELRRRSQFENSQDVKKRKVEEKKLRRRFMNRGRNTGPVSWDQYFGGDLANLNSQFGGEDLEFKFLQSETTIPCNAFDSLFSDEA